MLRKALSYVAVRTVHSTAVVRRLRTTSTLTLPGAPVNCVPLSLDRYGRTVATCSVAGRDLAEWLVRNGLALDWPQYSKGRYHEAQREAERAGLGLWKGSYIEPWLYRACIRAGGKPSDCSDDASAHP
ncbi:thermonuclease family protein [Bradyrhizobium sp. Arg237L]|uniref:thermonuclease family protein n=1 Tax=Bradyrhizobium sp. Arg237L TaxID=3003352 RepID=UPI0032B88276